MFENKLKDAFKYNDLNLTDDMLIKFNSFYKMVLEWNKKINLTAITEEDEFIKKHILDSLSAASFIENYNVKGKKHVLDIGAGAGFPGIPLKIYMEDLNIILMDALQKRVNFLDEVINKLEFKKISTLHARAEEAAKTNLRECFDIVASRAVASLPILLEYSLPFLKVGGIFIAWKGGKANEEANSSKNALNILGGNIVDIKKVIISGLKEERALIIVQKERMTSPDYPRRAGVPTKKPL